MKALIGRDQQMKIPAHVDITSILTDFDTISKSNVTEDNIIDIMKSHGLDEDRMVEIQTLLQRMRIAEIVYTHNVFDPMLIAFMLSMKLGVQLDEQLAHVVEHNMLNMVMNGWMRQDTGDDEWTPIDAHLSPKAEIAVVQFTIDMNRIENILH
jgi:ADP-dependent phosphofructokinase/glucokinase